MDGLSVNRDPGGALILAFRGPLDVKTTPALWSEATTAADAPGSTLVLDLDAVTTCDGAGVGLLVEADRRARAAGAETTVRGGSEELTELLRMARLAPDTTGEPARPGLVTQIGNATADLLDTTRAFVTFLGDLAVAVPRGFLTLRPARVKEISRQCTEVGADAVPVVSLLGGLVGLILAVQSVKALEPMGTTSLVPMVVGFATLREFGGLIAAIILAGRSGSAFAAEIGTMKVTEELDAYTTFALDPMVILVFPRVVAGVLMTPLLALFSIACGVLGGALPMFGQGYTLRAYLTGVIDSVVLADLVQALVKATAFGFIVSALGCFHGLRTSSGATSVGASATRAVVAGIVAVLVADSVLSSIFYSLGY
ncbi:MAG: STAS domain-containing protein [Planctomycetes bacterium]|nr:STAS domain-containing protein [Planctomycetota bacterium]